MRLGARETLTGAALLPPAGKSPLLLAVAGLDLNRRPFLGLYHFPIGTGELIRRFAGHVGRIHRLAFSPDGRLLASVADDQTVSVWTLTSLDQVLGRRGRLRGVEVQGGAGKLTVRVAPAIASSSRARRSSG